MNWTRQHDRPPLDAWLRGQLHTEYDATLDEALPEEMLRLLEGLTDGR